MTLNEKGETLTVPAMRLIAVGLGLGLGARQQITVIWQPMQTLMRPWQRLNQQHRPFAPVNNHFLRMFLPEGLRQDILKLSIFVDSQTLKALSHPSPVNVETLININRNIASGLLKSPKD